MTREEIVHFLEALAMMPGYADGIMEAGNSFVAVDKMERCTYMVGLGTVEGDKTDDAPLVVHMVTAVVYCNDDGSFTVYENDDDYVADPIKWLENWTSMAKKITSRGFPLPQKPVHPVDWREVPGAMN